MAWGENILSIVVARVVGVGDQRAWKIVADPPKGGRTKLSLLRHDDEMIERRDHCPADPVVVAQIVREMVLGRWGDEYAPQVTFTQAQDWWTPPAPPAPPATFAGYAVEDIERGVVYESRAMPGPKDGSFTVSASSSRRVPPEIALAYQLSKIHGTLERMFAHMTKG